MQVEGGKKRGHKTINTAGYIIKFERVRFGRGVLLLLLFKAQKEAQMALMQQNYLQRRWKIMTQIFFLIFFFLSKWQPACTATPNTE